MSIAARVFILLLMVAPLAGAGQTINTFAATESTTDGAFLYEVKLIDEFFERFNDAPGSYIRRESKRLLGTDSMINRRRLLRTLFKKGQNWSGDTALFMQQVVSSAHPQYLSFTDSNWYAVANCVFAVNGKSVQAPVVLHISTQGSGATWMIAGLGTSDIYNMPCNKVYTATPASKPDFIPTSSHGTDFVYLQHVFSKESHAANYFEPYMLEWERTRHLLGLVAEGKATFRYVKGIEYHFYGIPGWLFAVSYSKYKGANCGWLISNLQQMNDTAKASALQHLLW